MDEIKVGEYVKTNKGEICKVLGINKEIRDGNRIYSHKSYNLDNRKGSLTRAFIKNHSFDLKKLIEVGDIIEIILNERTEETTKVYIIDEQQLEALRTMKIKLLKTILTHEQYEINCYTVKEE